jgi:hypothetical protein
MAFFRQAEYHGSYSDSFREWRTAFLRRNFAAFASILVILLMSPFVARSLKKKIGKKKPIDRARFVSRRAFPFYLVLHPFKGWEELKRERQGSLTAANLILAGWFAMDIVGYQFTGFCFNYNRLDQMNLAINLASTIGVFFLWAVSNWGVSTLQEGKGTFKEIWIFSAYSRMTVVLTMIPMVIVSHLLCQEEGMFLQMASWVVDAWSALQMLVAIRAVHQYEMRQTIVSILLTILGILLIFIILALFVSLFSQVYAFGSTIFQEILLR